MNHPIHRVTRFSIVGPYTLAVGFSDNTEQRIDFEPVLRGALFEPLRDLATFNAVRLDDEAGTLVWPNDADFDPATLHDWPDVKDELASRARAWAGDDGGLTREWSDAPLTSDLRDQKGQSAAVVSIWFIVRESTAEAGNCAGAAQCGWEARSVGNLDSISTW
jgi:hypothetical protein